MTKPRARAVQPPADGLTDAGLVAACATGDRAALGTLFERHVDAVYCFVRSLYRSDPAAIEDVVQATFVAAFEAAHRFSGTSVKSWLFGIAANLIRGHTRRERRRRNALRVVSETSATSYRNDDVAMLARLPAAIFALPHDLRAALVIVDIEGERGVDAAAALGIPEGTLWRRVYYARQALRVALGGASWKP
jgi:RNA polymerase sigma-70 factor (ECF subfamily)